MRHIDYSNLNIAEVMRRLRQKRDSNNVILAPWMVVPLLLRYAVIIPLYKTRLTDHVDAVVELIEKIIPTTDLDELRRRARDGDGSAAHKLSVCMMFRLYGTLHDCVMIRYLQNRSISAAIGHDYRVIADCLEGSRCSAVVGCRCTHTAAMERLSFRSDNSDNESVVSFTWKLCDMLCAADYVCPISLVWAVYSRRWNPNHNSTIKQFLLRHPEAYRHYKVMVSATCHNSECDTRFCEPGLVVRCSVCGVPYCSTQCRDDARERHRDVCRPEMRRVTSLVFPFHNVSHPKPYLEHILGMFGIVLPPRNYEAHMMRASLQYDSTNIKEMTDMADEFARQGNHLCAADMYVAVLRILHPRGIPEKLSCSTAAITYKGAVSEYAIENLFYVGHMTEILLNDDNVKFLDETAKQQTNDMMVAAFNGPLVDISWDDNVPSDYDNIDTREVMRRIRQKRVISDEFTLLDIITLLLQNAVTIPLYKTSLSDPTDAIVELLCNIIPNTTVAELEHRVSMKNPIALSDLELCYRFGVSGAAVDLKKADYYFNVAPSLLPSMAHNLTLMASTVSSYRLSISDMKIEDKFLVIKEPVSQQQNVMFEQTWKMLSDLCRLDYACIETYMMAMEARVNWPLYNTQDIQQFLSRHPEAAELYAKSVSVPCSWMSCLTGYCDPGVHHRCGRCGMPFCSVVCRDMAMMSHVNDCHPEREMPLSWRLARDADDPKPWLEHVLNMFGIELPKRYRSSVTADKTRTLGDKVQSHVTSTPETCGRSNRSVGELVSAADRLADCRHHMRAIRLLNEAIEIVSDVTSPDMPELMYKRGKCFYNANRLDSAMSDFNDIVYGYHEISKVDPLILTEVADLMEKIEKQYADGSGISQPQQILPQASQSTQGQHGGGASTRRNRKKKEKRRNKLKTAEHDEYDGDQDASSSTPPVKPMHDYTLMRWTCLDSVKYDCCPICSREPDELADANAVVFKCGHTVCSGCLCTLVKSSRDKSDVITSLSCPMCRAELPSNILTVVAKQFIVDDHSAVELQSIVDAMHLRKPDEVCVSLFVKNDFNTTSCYIALFKLARMVKDVSMIKNVLEQSSIVDKLTRQFYAVLDTTTDSFKTLKDDLHTAKASLQDTISQAIRGCNCQPIYNSGALSVSFKGFDLEQSLYALHYVLLPILPVYGRTSIHDIDRSVRNDLISAMPRHLRYESHSDTLTLKSS